jgi:hypothetical protein
MRNTTTPPNEKTRQKAGFSEVSEMLKAFSGTFYGAAPGVENLPNLLTLKRLNFEWAAIYP